VLPEVYLYCKMSTTARVAIDAVHFGNSQSLDGPLSCEVSGNWSNAARLKTQGTRHLFQFGADTRGPTEVFRDATLPETRE
jgi:hypothetical protein